MHLIFSVHYVRAIFGPVAAHSGGNMNGVLDTISGDRRSVLCHASEEFLCCENGHCPEIGLLSLRPESHTKSKALGVNASRSPRRKAGLRTNL